MRHALRSLAATPVVSLVAVVSLALGIGANTAIFTIIDSLMLRSLPVHEPERLALVTAAGRPYSWTNPIWEAIRDRPLFGAALAQSADRFNLARGGGETEMIDGAWVSGRYFEVLGVPAMLGRTFTADDDRRGGGRDGAVAVLSYAFWRSRYGGAAGALGQTIAIERVPCTIIGVLPPGFHGLNPGRSSQVYIPIGVEPLVRGAESMLDHRSYWWLDIMVRLRDGQDVGAATAALRGVQPQIRAETVPGDLPAGFAANYLKEPFTLVPSPNGFSVLRTRYAPPLIALMVVVGLVLLIACANIANLLLARAAARRHEIGVRLALGASRLRLWRMLFAESLLIAALGAALGLLFAEWGSRLLVAQLSSQTRVVFLDMPLDWRVLGFTSAVAVLTALLFGSVPAFRGARVQPSESLGEESRGSAGDPRSRLVGALIAAQVALSLVLVFAAGLFVRTFASLASMDTGFDRGPVLIAALDLQRSAVEPSGRPALVERMREAVSGVPGVGSAAASHVTPVSGSTWSFPVEVDGGRELTSRERGVSINALTPGWFGTLGTTIIRGRDFDSRDTAGAPRVAVVNEAFVKRFFHPGTDPIGRTVREKNPIGGRPVPPPAQIVGVVEDAVYRSLREPVPPTMYLALAQFPGPMRAESNIVIRSAGPEPAALARGVAEAIGRVDPDAAISFRLLAEQVDSSLAQERLIAILSGFFGALALLLAGLGLYGVTVYSVNRRRREIGIRMALGAEPGRVVRLVLRRVAVLVAIGAVSGGIAALWASRFASTLLFGLEPRDPATFAGAVAMLAVTAALSGWIPARRASRLDPARTLHES
ncbi:MAG: ABC transporter permease [Vicinamibacterales bacterium]